MESDYMRIGTLRVTLFVLFCGLVISSTEVHAQANGSSSAKASEVKPVERPWNVQLGFTFGSTLRKTDSYERQTVEALSLSPSYRFSENWAFGASTSILRDDSIAGVGNTSVDNTLATFSYTKKLSAKMKWKTTFGGVLPTNQDMREQTTYQGAVKLGTGLSFEDLALGSAIRTGLTSTRNFHQYTEDADGGSNIRESLGLTLNGDLPVYKTVSFFASFAYTGGRSYRDNVATKFSFESGFSWAATKALELALSTSNEGNALKPNGRDSNIEFFNNDTSTINFGLSYTL